MNGYPESHTSQNVDQPPFGPQQAAERDDTHIGWMRELALRAYISATARLGRQRKQALEQWNDLSWRKQAVQQLGFFATNAAGLAVAAWVARTTGVFDGFGSAGGGAAHSGALAHESLPAYTASFHEHLAAATPDQTALVPQHIIKTEVVLPPAPTDHIAFNLKPWDPSERTGAVWYKVEDYAKALNYSELTDQQVHAAVDATLKTNHLSWEQANSLPVGRRIELLTPNQMDSVLQHSGAHRTHAPSYSSPPTPHEPSPPTPKPSATQPPHNLPPTTTAPSSPATPTRSGHSWIESIEEGALSAASSALATVGALALAHPHAAWERRKYLAAHPPQSPHAPLSSHTPAPTTIATPRIPPPPGVVPTTKPPEHDTDRTADSDRQDDKGEGQDDDDSTSKTSPKSPARQRWRQEAMKPIRYLSQLVRKKPSRP